MATHAGVALELGIKRPASSSGGVKMMSPQMEAILIWCQCRTREYVSVLELLHRPCMYGSFILINSVVPQKMSCIYGSLRSRLS